MYPAHDGGFIAGRRPVDRKVRCHARRAAGLAAGDQGSATEYVADVLDGAPSQHARARVLAHAMARTMPCVVFAPRWMVGCNAES